MQGVEFINCNCAWGCPCQFNSLPTYGDCRALGFGQIEQGRYGDVPLDGLRWGVLLAWPKAIHFGNGTMQAIVDERADARQRAALEAIIQGRDTDGREGRIVARQMFVVDRHVIVDDTDALRTRHEGTWERSKAVLGYYGTGYQSIAPGPDPAIRPASTSASTGR